MKMDLGCIHTERTRDVDLLNTVDTYTLRFSKKKRRMLMCEKKPLSGHSARHEITVLVEETP